MWQKYIVLTFVYVLLLTGTTGDIGFRHKVHSMRETLQNRMRKIAHSTSTTVQKAKNWFWTKVCGPPPSRTCSCTEIPVLEVGTEPDLPLQEDLTSAICDDFGMDPNVGLTKEVIDDAFDQCDEDADGSLNDREVDLLEDVLEIYDRCLEIIEDTHWTVSRDQIIIENK